MKKLLLILLLLVGGIGLPSVQSAEPVPFNGLIVDQTGKGIKARITVKSDERYTHGYARRHLQARIAGDSRRRTPEPAHPLDCRRPGV